MASFIVKSVLMTQPNHHSFEHVNVLKKPSFNCIDTLCAPLKVCFVVLGWLPVAHAAAVLSCAAVV